MDASWPVGRCDHAAVCILGHIGRQAGPLLLIAGGIDNSNQILRDCWIFAIDTAKWMKVEELKSMNYHVLCMYHDKSCKMDNKISKQHLCVFTVYRLKLQHL